MDDADVAASLNTPNRTVTRAVPKAAVRSLLQQRGVWAGLRIAANTATAGDAAGMAALTLVDALLDSASDTTTVDMTDPAVAATVSSHLDALVTGELLSAADRVALLTLASPTVSRAHELGLPTVEWADVAEARRIA